MKNVRTRDKIRKSTENPNKEYLEPQIPSSAQEKPAMSILTPAEAWILILWGGHWLAGVRLSLNPKPK